MLTTLAPGNVMTVWKLDRKRHVHANRSNMVSPSMLTSIPASRLNQKEPKKWEAPIDSINQKTSLKPLNRVRESNYKLKS
jgi:hypothetical protein